MSNPFNTNYSSLRQGGNVGYVVGSYNDLGSPIHEGKFSADATEVQSLAEAYDEHASRSADYNPATLVKSMGKTNSRKKKKKTIKPVARKQYEDTEEPFPFFDKDIPEVDPLEEIQRRNQENYANEEKVEKYQPKTSKKVQFSNNFGSIKVSVESIMRCDMAVALLFNHEDDIIFTPKAGESLSLIIDGETTNVYYPDVLFSLPGGTKKIMILFTVDDKQSTEESYE
jgi:hypothetical protein